MAIAHPPTRITPGPEGSWPLRFDRLVQPVLNARCVECHTPQGTNQVAARFDLSTEKAYETLVAYGKPSLRDQVWDGYRRGFSIPGQAVARTSALLKLLSAREGHCGVILDADSRDRLVTWMDTYAQRTGHFSEEQEQQLIELKRASYRLLSSPAQNSALNR